MSFIISGLLLFGTHADCFGQKVALVLSGGGSRGAAHIGVLKALEENNIPIDYIAGTSIGAIVGGLYASGYSIEEMEGIFTNDAFARWAAGSLDPGYSYLYKNDPPDASWIDLDLDFRKKFSSMIPTNMISPVEMDFAFMKLFSGAAAVAGYNFDNLFVPFRCMAADIDSNKSVVLNHGDLDKAIRASMTFPFYFKPIEIDNKLLFDGGMYNNFPADVAMDDFSPDVIIGSKVAGNYPKPQPDDILSQIQNMLMADTDFNMNIDSSILIEPPVEKVNLVDFSKSGAFIDSGYHETLRKMEQIKKLVRYRRDKTVVNQQRHNFNTSKPPYIIDSVYISGLNKNQSEYVYKTLLQKTIRKPLDEVEPEYFKLAADDKIKSITSIMRYNENSGCYGLYLKLKSANKFSLKFGGNISTRLANQAFVELQYKYLFRNALRVRTNVYFGKFYTSVLLGARMDFPGKMPLYLGGNLVYNQFDYFKSTIHFFEDITPSFLIQNNNYFRAFVGVPTSSKGKLEIDYTLAALNSEYYQSNIFKREDTADRTQFGCMAGKLNWELSSLNRKQYASAGARFFISAGFVTGEEKFTSGSLSNQSMTGYKQSHEWFMFKLVWDNYFEKIGPVSLGFYGELYLSSQQFFSNYTASILAAPAFEPVPESKTIFLPNFRAYNYGAVGLKGILKLSKSFDLRTGWYLFQPYQQIFQNEDFTARFGGKFENRYLAASASLVFHTYIGPISMSVNY
nr:patatin-like phospholipase family protein [Bacteroidota bacterium]